MEQKLSDSIKETIQGVSEKSTQLEKVHFPALKTLPENVKIHRLTGESFRKFRAHLTLVNLFNFFNCVLFSDRLCIVSLIESDNFSSIRY